MKTLPHSDHSKGRWVTIFCLIVSCFILLPHSSATEKNKPQPYYVTVEKLNVREKPSLNSKVVATLALGDHINVIKTTHKATFQGINNDWFELQPDGGFIFGAFINPMTGDLVCQYNMLSWLNMTADKFGCYLETEFHWKDKYFNCKLNNYKPVIDPCLDKEKYRLGPLFPKTLLRKIHPDLTDLTLVWKAGKLIGFSMACQKKIDHDTLRKTFLLPGEGSFSDLHVYDISIKSSPNNLICLNVLLRNPALPPAPDCD